MSRTYRPYNACILQCLRSTMPAWDEPDYSPSRSGDRPFETSKNLHFRIFSCKWWGSIFESLCLQSKASVLIWQLLCSETSHLFTKQINCSPEQSLYKKVPTYIESGMYVTRLHVYIMVDIALPNFRLSPCSHFSITTSKEESPSSKLLQLQSEILYMNADKPKPRFKTAKVFISHKRVKTINQHHVFIRKPALRKRRPVERWRKPVRLAPAPAPLLGTC